MLWCARTSKRLARLVGLFRPRVFNANIEILDIGDVIEDQAPGNGDPVGRLPPQSPADLNPHTYHRHTHIRTPPPPPTDTVILTQKRTTNGTKLTPTPPLAPVTVLVNYTHTHQRCRAPLAYTPGPNK